VRILDFFWLGAGPMASLLLEHLGAEVIKVESAQRMDKIRDGGPYPTATPDPDEAGVFASLNYGKKSMLLYLSHPEARTIVFDLVRSCQVVTNNFKAATMGRFGISYEELAHHNPAIVYITMSTMGAEGPFTSYGAYGSHLAALTGFNMLSGLEGELPIGLGTLFPDFSCNPFHATAAILAGLRHVRATGAGVKIDIAQFESTLHLLGPALKLASVTHTQPQRVGSQHAWRVPHGVYRCAGEDEWLALSVGRDAEWHALVALIGDEVPGPWKANGTFIGRQRCRTMIDTAVSAWCEKHEKWCAADALLTAGIPAWPVSTIKDQLEGDAVLSRSFTTVPLPSGARATIEPFPIDLGEGDGVAVTRPPLLGEHSFQVLEDLCGYPPEHIAKLVASGILQ
jgi:benzylsuccinate CoA-transferase BbsF subunit